MRVNRLLKHVEQPESTGTSIWLRDHHLRLFRELKSLNLSSMIHLTDNGLKGLRLTSLDLTKNRLVTDEGIRGMPLTRLLANSNITNDGIKGMALTVLDLNENHRITGEGIEGTVVEVIH